MRQGIFWGQTSSLGRLFALTDGVYAIVVTLLVLDLKIPKASHMTDAELLADLVKQIPNFVAYLISFLGIAIFWMRNHWILKPLSVCDEKAFWLNLLHLFFLSLIPYTTSLVGHYEQDALAVAVFAGSIGLCGLSLLFLHRYLIHKTEWLAEAPVKAWISPNWWVDYPAPFFAIGSICLAFVSIPAALGFWFLLPVWVFLLILRQ